MKKSFFTNSLATIIPVAWSANDMSKIRRLAVLLPLLAWLAGCATAPAPAGIADTISRNAATSSLAKLIADAGLTETLNGPGPFTVFAPSNEAIQGVPAKTMAELAANKELLKGLLTYHVVPGRITAAEAKQGNLKTVNGANVAVSKSGSFVTVEDAVVQQADLPATNGVIHVIDRVLMPPRR